MFKTELIRKIAIETRVGQRVVSDVVNETPEQVTFVLAKNGEIRLPGFGVFHTRKRAAFRLSSIKSGRPVEVPSHRVIGFRVGEVLRRAAWKDKKDKQGTVPPSEDIVGSVSRRKRGAVRILEGLGHMRSDG